MPSSDHPADFTSLVSRRLEADRSLIVHLAGDPGSPNATAGLRLLCDHLNRSPDDAERIALTDPAQGHHFLETAAPGEVLVIERRQREVPEGTWGPLVTLFANARYEGVHVVILSPGVPTLVRRGVNVRVDSSDDDFEVALLEPAPEDPERTQEIDLGTL